MHLENLFIIYVGFVVCSVTAVVTKVRDVVKYVVYFIKLKFKLRPFQWFHFVVDLGEA